VSARAWALLSAAWIAAAAGCTTPSSEARFVATPPDRASFPPVAQMLVVTCGTLDCHGTVARNFKIYGNVGLRFAPADVPSALTATTSDEVDQTFASLVGLEPEILSEVVTSGGQAPERLTVVRKARGAEHHNPGAIVTTGDDRDVCLTSWLAGKVDTGACTRALDYP
jgi:hypothetical protein